MLNKTALLLAVVFFSGCAAYRSDIGGAFIGEEKINERAIPVSVTFVFSHINQRVGFDTVPKLTYAPAGFQDILRDALPELTNIRSYVTFTESANDVDNPRRRAELDSLTSSNDYVISMRFSRKTSFPSDFLWGMVATGTMTGIPARFDVNYEVTTDVRDREGRMIKRYHRNAEIKRWVQTFLVFVYPFHPEERKIEEVYVEFIKNIFREIESDRILTKQ
jgi:hypothetical protein